MKVVEAHSDKPAEEAKPEESKPEKSEPFSFFKNVFSSRKKNEFNVKVDIPIGPATIQV